MTSGYKSPSVPQMEEPQYKNFNVHRDLDITPEDVSRLCRRILARAVGDLKGTSNYAKHRKSGVPGSWNPYHAMEIGEEVREWMQDAESDDLFSFRTVCFLAGRDYRKILRAMSKYMEPKNRYLARWMNIGSRIVSLLEETPGLSDTMLRYKLRRNYPPIVINKTMKQLKKHGIVSSTTTRYNTKRSIVRWYLKQGDRGCNKKDMAYSKYSRETSGSIRTAGSNPVATDTFSSMG